MEAVVFISLLLLGSPGDLEQLGRALDGLGISASEAAESSLRRTPSAQGFVGCNPGADLDARERAQIIAKRAFALSGAGRVLVSGGQRSSGDAQSNVVARSAFAVPPGWTFVAGVVHTEAGGDETCVALLSPQTATSSRVTK